MKTPIKNKLFEGFEGCGNHRCFVKKPVGMGANGPCLCAHSRTLNAILWARISTIDKGVNE